MGFIKNKKNYRAYIVHGWTYSTEKYKKIAELLTNHGVQTEILKIPGLTEKIDKSWGIDDYVEWLRRKIDIYSSSEGVPSGTPESRSLSSRQDGYRTGEYHSVPPSPEPYGSGTVTRQARTITINNNKLILIGHSNGGRIAATYASIYPQNLDHLILIDCAGILHNELHVKLRLLFFSTLAKLGRKVGSSTLLKKLLYKMTGESDYNNATPIMKKTMTNLIKKDLSLSLTKITTPTLIIWGQYDKVTPISDAKIIHRLIKNSRLHIVKGAKHSPHFTHAEEVVKIIVKHLKTQNAKVKIAIQK